MKKIALFIFTAWFALLSTNTVAGSYGKHKKDIVDTAIENGNFTTLVKAVQAADLVNTLKSEGPFTVFAPTDEAFAKIPQDQLAALIADKEALTGVLTYHVVAGKVPSKEVVNLNDAKTVQGQSVDIKTENGKVFVNDAQIVITDIKTSNGIIHVIDSVIMPKS